MKLERTKNAARNTVFGFLLKIYQLLVPFALRTVMFYCLGIEYLGLNSLFTSVISVLNLAELGVGSAMVFSMYKPIAEDDKDTICALMRLYKIYYRVIGAVILVIGMALTPVIPYLVKGDIPSELNLIVLYYINLAACVLSYWLFAYKNSLLSAHQRTDVSNKVTIIVNTVTYIVQFVLLIVFHNYYMYITVSLVMQAVTNIVTAIVVNRMYPKYKAKGELPKNEVKSINRKVRDLFTAKLGGAITNSADAIVVSAFLGVTILAQYTNYNYILSSIIGFIMIALSACTAGIGNSLVTESEEKNYKDFRTIIFMTMGAVAVCTTCFVNMFQPFMKIWMGDENLLSMSVVICFCVYFVVYEINTVLNLFKDAAGIWHQDRFRPLVVSLVNLTLNIISVRYLGLYGVILSTVVSMCFIGIPWVSYNVLSNIFKGQSKRKFLRYMMRYVCQIIVICVFGGVVGNLVKVEGFVGLALRLLISLVMAGGMFVLFNIRQSELWDLRDRVMRFVKR